MLIPKTAYNQEYISSVFSFEQPNPMLVYDDQTLPFTTINLIDISYLQQVYNLDVQLFGFRTWLRKMGVHNFSKSENISYSSSQTLDSEDFKNLDQALQARLFVTWQESFSQYCLTFHHWFEFYNKKHLTPENHLHCDHEQNEASVMEDWDNAIYTFLPPLSSSLKIHTTDLYLQENSMVFHALNNIKLMILQQEPNNLRRLETVAKEVSNTIINAQTWEKPGLASLVNGYSFRSYDRSYFRKTRKVSSHCPTTSRTSLWTNSSSKKSPLSSTSLRRITNRRNFRKKLSSKRFASTKDSPNLKFLQKIFVSGKLTDAYIPNYTYLLINMIETLNITSDRLNGDIISNEDRFYVWARLKLA